MTNSVSTKRKTGGAARPGPKKKEIGDSFGLVGLKFVPFTDLDFGVKSTALDIVSRVSEKTAAELAEFANEFKEELTVLSDSEAKILYPPLKKTFEDIYKAVDVTPHRQQLSRVRKAIAKVRYAQDSKGKKVDLKDAPKLPINGVWGVQESILLLGSTGCACAGRSSSTRPYLPLVGALLLLLNRNELIEGMQGQKLEPVAEAA